MALTASDVTVTVGVDATSIQRGMQAARAQVLAAAGGIEGDFRKVGRAANDAGRQVEAAGRRTRQSSAAWGVLRSRLLGVIAVAASLRTAMQAIGTTDRMALLDARVASLTGSTKAAKEATDSLYESSQALQAPYDDMVGSFARILPAVQRLGGGIDEARRLSESLVVTARASGSSTAEAAASAQQFAQALGSGKLAGDELRSILENNQQLALLIADGFGVSVGKLKDMGAAGELTSARVGNAILKQQQRIADMARSLPQTVAGSWTVAINAIQRLVVQVDKATGASEGLVGVLRGLTIVIESGTQLLRDFNVAGNNALDPSKGTAFGEVMIKVFAVVGDAVAFLAQRLLTVKSLITGIITVASDLIGGDLEAAKNSAKATIDDIVGYATASFAILKGDGLSGQIDAMIGKFREGRTMTLGVDGVGGKPLADGDSSTAKTGKEDRTGAQLVEVEIERRKQAAEAAMELDEMVAKHRADASGASIGQVIAMETQFEAQRYQIAMQALQSRLELLSTDPTKSIVEIAKTHADIEKAEQEHSKRLLAIQQQTQRQQRGWYDAWTANIQSGMAQLFQSIATGSLKVRDVARTAMIGLLDITTNILSQMAAQWIVSNLIGNKSTFASALSRISAHAATAGAAAVASTAAIPIVGPALAPAAGLAASSAALAFSSLLAPSASAAGGYDIPASINPVTQLHAREMVLPAPLAETVRSAMGEGGGGRQPVNMTMSVQAVDPQSFERYLKNNGATVARAMQDVMRQAGMVPR